MLFKITVLGDGGVGKTALTVQVRLVFFPTIFTRSTGFDIELIRHAVYHVVVCRGAIFILRHVANQTLRDRQTDGWF